MVLRCLLLSASPYRMDDGTEGISIEWVEEGDPINTPRRKGVDVMRDSAPMEALSGITEVPGLYDVTMGRVSKTDARGKRHAQLVPKQFAFAGSVRLFEIVKPGGNISTARAAAPSPV